MAVNKYSLARSESVQDTNRFGSTRMSDNTIFIWTHSPARSNLQFGHYSGVCAGNTVLNKLGETGNIYKCNKLSKFGGRNSFISTVKTKYNK